MSERVAVLGLGGMGSRLARRLVDGGCEVVVWNRTPARAEAAAAWGARPAASPAEAARDAGLVVTMVADPAALAAVTEGQDGALAGMREGSVLVEMSTVGPTAVARLREAAPPGVAVVDAPVLGSLSEADAGTLHVFVGGDAPAVERCLPVLGLLGRPVVVGGPGAGAAAKLVANTTLVGVLTVLGEAMAVGRGLGLPDAVLFEVLARTPLAAQAERRRPAVESGEYPLRFALGLAVKDADLIRDAAAAAGVDVRTVEAARSWFADAAGGGLAGADYSAVMAWILGRAGRAGAQAE
ncbi:MAG TPA: NAD(P)-dependent oxidoreductase [Acidimicrobiales bacterium]